MLPVVGASDVNKIPENRYVALLDFEMELHDLQAHTHTHRVLYVGQAHETHQGWKISFV